MAFEGEPLSTPIKGIQRAGADGVIEDGACQDVIGLEYKDGSYIPYAPTIRSSSFAGYDSIVAIRVHHTSVQNNIVVILSKRNSANTIMWESMTDYDSECIDEVNHAGSSGALVAFDEIDNEESPEEVEFVGNMICIKTNKQIKYYLFNGTTYKYQDFNYSNLPTVEFATDRMFPNEDDEEDNSKIALEYMRCNFYQSTSSPEEPLVKNDTIGAMLTAVKGEATRRGGLTGYVLVSYAWRLKNGKFVYASTPRLIGRPDNRHDGYLHLLSSESTSINNPSYSSSGWSTKGTVDMYKDSAVLMRKDRIKHVNNINYLSQLFECSEKHPSEIKFSLLNQEESAVLCTLNDSGSSYNPYPTSSVNFPDLMPFNRFVTLHKAEHLNKDKNLFYGWYDLFAYQIANRLKYKINGSFSSSDLIESLCIFMSPEIDPYSEIKEIANRECTGVKKVGVANQYASESFAAQTDILFETYAQGLKDADKINEDLKDIRNMYLIKEILVDDIRNMDEYEYIDLKDILGDTLLTRTSLDITAFNYRKTNGNLFTYNHRLHVTNYVQKLFDGFKLKDYSAITGAGLDGNTITAPECEIDVYLKNEDTGESVVVGYESTSQTLALGGFIAYPDSNAYKMIIRLKKNGTSYYQKNLLLHSNESLGISFYANDFGHNFKLSDFDEFGSISGIKLPIATSKNSTVSYPCGMKVSDTAFPSYFPAAATYIFDNSRLVGLAILTISMANDNYGKNPLLAFTGEGIYALTVDTSGATAYLAVNPFSHEVCLERRLMCEIDGAVVFLSAKGLMIASENGVQEFLPALNGDPKNMPKNDMAKGKGMLAYRFALGGKDYGNKKIDYSTKTVNLLNAISTKDFISEVMSSAVSAMHYISCKNKIMITTGKDQGHYFIDIPTRITTKLQFVGYEGDYNHPEDSFYDGSQEYKINYKSSGRPVDCMLLTRPIRISQKLKGTLRVILRGRFTGIDPVVSGANRTSKFAELHVYGSLDAMNWQLIGIKEKELCKNGFEELGCVVDRASINYILVMFSGELYSDSHIDMIDISYKKRNNNQLE